jgi:hypothetical protein
VSFAGIMDAANVSRDKTPINAPRCGELLPPYDLLIEYAPVAGARAEKNDTRPWPTAPVTGHDVVTGFCLMSPLSQPSRALSAAGTLRRGFGGANSVSKRLYPFVIY